MRNVDFGLDPDSNKLSEEDILEIIGEDLTQPGIRWYLGIVGIFLGGQNGILVMLQEVIVPI